MRPIGPMALACLIAAAALFLSQFAQAQLPDRDLPTHAHYSATEQGWTCNDGFKQAAGYCISDTADIPSQGPFEVFDGQWRCRSGYKRSGGLCVIITAPEHATQVEPGGGWECDWGYRRVASRCEEVNAPAHAYVDASGHDWVCYPGFQRSTDHCIPAATGGAAESGGTTTGADESKPHL